MKVIFEIRGVGPVVEFDSITGFMPIKPEEIELHKVFTLLGARYEITGIETDGTEIKAVIENEAENIRRNLISDTDFFTGTLEGMITEDKLNPVSLPPNEMQEITETIGSWINNETDKPWLKKVRFIGRKIADKRNNHMGTVTTWTIYQKQESGFLLFKEIYNNFAVSPVTKEMFTHDSLDALHKDHPDIPAVCINEARENSDTTEVETI